MGNPLYEVMALLDAAGVGGRSVAEQVEALLAQTQKAAKETDYDRLLAALDEDRCLVLMALHEVALDEGHLEEARGWGWLWTHRRWPVRLHSGVWHWTDMRDTHAGMLSHAEHCIPQTLHDAVLAARREELGAGPAGTVPGWRSAGEALRAVVGVIASGGWTSEVAGLAPPSGGRAPSPLEAASRRALERFGREVARAARRDAGL